jgi:hypothetical protein
LADGRTASGDDGRTLALPEVTILTAI